MWRLLPTHSHTAVRIPIRQYRSNTELGSTRMHCQHPVEMLLLDLMLDDSIPTSGVRQCWAGLNVEPLECHDDHGW